MSRQLTRISKKAQVLASAICSILLLENCTKPDHSVTDHQSPAAESTASQNSVDATPAPTPIATVAANQASPTNDTSSPDNVDLPADLKSSIDKIISPFVDSKGSIGKAPGIVVGILTPQYRQVLGYGVTKAGGVDVPNGQTIFEIGSVSKVFTGLLLALEVKSQKMALDDAIEKYLPSGMSAPSYSGTKISLLDLATHYSGLPMTPTNATSRPFAEKDYDETLLSSFLQSYTLSYSPGTKFAYSNLGPGLLGFLISNLENQSYDTLLTTQICAPLNMPDTRVSLTTDQKNRMSSGYSDNGKVDSVNLGILSGAGAIKSTADDILNFLAAQIFTDSKMDTTLKSAIDLFQTDQRGKTPKGSIGLSVDIDSDFQMGTLHSKSGSTVSFTSYIIFSKDSQTGVVILANALLVKGNPIPVAGLDVLKLLNGH